MINQCVHEDAHQMTYNYMKSFFKFEFGIKVDNIRPHTYQILELTQFVYKIGIKTHDK